MTSQLRVALGVLLTVSAVRADMIDDYHTAPGTVAPFSASGFSGRRIMVIGDSIMSGTGLTKSEDQATFRLQRYGGVIIHNFASPGACMADVSVLPGMNHTAPTTIGLLSGFFGMYGLVVSLGTNDWGQSLITPTSFSSAYGAFLDTERGRPRRGSSTPTARRGTTTGPSSRTCAKRVATLTSTACRRSRTRRPTSGMACI